MKVTAVKTYLVPPEISVTSWGKGQYFALVKLETDEGIEGWGEAHTFHDCEHAIAREIQNLSRHMDGMDPFCIKHFMTMASDSIRNSPNGIEVAAAAAGIEIALWDIVGKALGTPVYNLLGGPCRDRVGVYANCWSDVVRSPEELADFARNQVDGGFKAVKIYPFLYGSTVDEGIERLRAVRDVVGPDISVFVDMWYKTPERDLTQVIDALQAHGVSWFEDPAESYDVEALARIRKQTDMPVVSGETLYSKQAFLRTLEHEAADVLNPDITLFGILGLKEIAAMAEAFSIDVSSHNNNTMTVGLAAAMQAAAVIPNSRLVEYFPRFAAGSNKFSGFPFELDEDGCIPLPRAPGIGVTVDEAALAATGCTLVTS
jgi:galactonate dehydratase